MGMKQFRTDANSVSEGLWIELPFANEDGTIPAFKMRGMGSFNPGFTAFRTKKYKPFAKLMAANALPQPKLDKLFLETVKEYALTDWRNVQPQDDGINLEYNEANVDSIVFATEWRALIEFITDKAGEYDTYNRENVEAIAGN